MNKCQQCNAEFSTPQGLSLHITRKHRKITAKRKVGGKRKFPVHFCPGCGFNLDLLNRCMSAAERLS